MVTSNFFGRCLGLLRGLYKVADKLFKKTWEVWLILLPGVTVLYTILNGEVDNLLASLQTLSLSFDDLTNGAVGSASIGDLLATANYYFPFDTIGHLSSVYFAVWAALVVARYAKEIVGFALKMLSGFK